MGLCAVEKACCGYCYRMLEETMGMPFGMQSEHLNAGRKDSRVRTLRSGKGLHNCGLSDGGSLFQQEVCGNVQSFGEDGYFVVKNNPFPVLDLAYADLP